MGKFDRVLFASDFDHTLSNLKNEVPPENVEAIRYFMAEGGIFTIASGRSIPMLRQKAGLVPTNAPCIVYNGAACYDYHTETLEYAQPLTGNAFALVQALRERFPEERIEVQTQALHYAYGFDANRDAYLRANDTPFAYAQGEIPQPWLKFAVYGKFHRPMFDAPGEATAAELTRIAEIEAFGRAFSDGSYTVIRSGARVVEVFNSQCSKGGAARHLAHRLDRPILACAGDAPNDITMLTEADFAFCPADGEAEVLTLPGVIPVAPCSGAAVADAIDRLEKLL